MDGNDIGIHRGGVGGTCGIEIVAIALRDGSCALRILTLRRNSIDMRGTLLLANSLTNNDALEELHLDDNPGSHAIESIAAFSKLLCDVTDANATYLSNHTLRVLGLGGDVEASIVSPSSPPDDDVRNAEAEVDHRRRLASNLELNSSSSYRVPPPIPPLHPPTTLSSVGRKVGRSRTSDVAIRKILRNHPHIDVSSLLEWDVRLLPHVVHWFDGKATPSWKNDASTRGSTSSSSSSKCNDAYAIDIETRKRGAMYEFVRAMPTTAWYASDV
jgi:hypothetical protein